MEERRLQASALAVATYSGKRHNPMSGAVVRLFPRLEKVEGLHKARGTAHSAGNNTKPDHADELDHSRLSRSMLFCRIVVIGLMLALSACAPDFDFKRDFLCRPDGHCVNASPGHTGIGI